LAEVKGAIGMDATMVPWWDLVYGVHGEESMVEGWSIAFDSLRWSDGGSGSQW